MNIIIQNDIHVYVNKNRMMILQKIDLIDSLNITLFLKEMRDLL